MKLAIVAGEPSGDIFGGFLLESLHQVLPDIINKNLHGNVCGIGGPNMIRRGFISYYDMQKLSVRGYVETLGSIMQILRIRYALRQQLIKQPPKVFVGIDAPDFNLNLECALRAKGIPTIHFVSPSIWAWRGSRIKKIAKAVDHMLCIFPFEKKIYDSAGIRASYVGHPMAAKIALKIDQENAKTKLGLAKNAVVLAVLPGSRLSEIKALTEVFFKTMLLIKKLETKIRFVLPIAAAHLADPIKKIILNYQDNKDNQNLEVIFLQDQSGLAMAAADVILLGAGTATLEAALYKKPMVIAYKWPWITAKIMQHQAYIPYVGLPNILAKRFVVPEFLQKAVTPEALAKAVFSFLNKDNKELIQLFHNMHLSLLRDTDKLTADAVKEFLM